MRDLKTASRPSPVDVIVITDDGKHLDYSQILAISQLNSTRFEMFLALKTPAAIAGR